MLLAAAALLLALARQPCTGSWGAWTRLEAETARAQVLLFLLVTREGGAAAPHPARPLPAPASEAEPPELSAELLASLALEMREVGAHGGAPHARLHGCRRCGEAGQSTP